MTSDVFRSFLTYLPTMPDDFYPVMSDIWGLFGPRPLPTLKSDVIYGRSPTKYMGTRILEPQCTANKMTLYNQGHLKIWTEHFAQSQFNKFQLE
jgi:hypothetical protein